MKDKKMILVILGHIHFYYLFQFWTLTIQIKMITEASYVVCLENLKMSIVYH